MKPLASVQYVDVRTGRLTLEGMQLFGPVAAQADSAMTTAAIGVTVQPYDVTLMAFAGLAGDADQVPYFTGPDVMALADFTAAGRDMVGALDAAAQTALLDVFTSALDGLAPASGGGTANFLRADGTWAEPAAGGVAVSYETVASNLDASDAVYAYAGGDLDTITYANGVVKSFSYSGGNLVSVTLSGATPSGIDLVKTLTYTGDDLTGKTYS
jgi:hypothetical protein